MSTHQHIPRQIMTSAYALIDKMPALKTHKDPRWAAVAGFTLGGLGLGLFFGTLTDFLVPVFIWIVLMIVGLPTGELLVITAPGFCALYGWKRAKSSNAKLDGGSSLIVEAEVITDSPQTLVPREAADWRLQAHLQRLDDLRNSGILTPSEHAVRRAKILQ